MSDLVNNQKEDFNKDQVLSLWEYLEDLIKDWKMIVIIVAIALVLGAAVSTFRSKEEIYTFSRQVIYEDCEFYPLDIHNTYLIELREYLNSNYDIPVHADYGVNEDNEGILSVYFSGYTFEEAEDIAENIFIWHNNTIYNEISRRINEKESIVDIYYKDYTNIENQYYNFLHNDGGYYDTNSDLSKYRGYINSYERQLDSSDKILAKVENDVPLLINEIFLSEGMPIEYSQIDEIIENHYSAEDIKKEIEFVETELEKNKEIYANVSALFEEMTVTNATMATEREVAHNMWRSVYVELEKLKLDLDSVDTYYISGYQLQNIGKVGFSTIMCISFVMGLVAAMVLVIVKNSYIEYKKTKISKA